jgi:hypothetical protein
MDASSKETLGGTIHRFQNRKIAAMVKIKINLFTFL